MGSYEENSLHPSHNSSPVTHDWLNSAVACANVLQIIPIQICGQLIWIYSDINSKRNNYSFWLITSSGDR